jgi:hypothetical protein
MRKSASEVIRNLESRIARLEKQSSSSVYQKKLESFESGLKKDIKSLFSKYDKLENPDEELIQLFNGFADSRGQISYDLNALIAKLESVMEAMDEASDKLSK